MAKNLSDYLSYISTQSIRHPIYRVDFLDRQSENIIKTFTGDLMDSEGQITNTLNDGVRRACSFSLKNFNQEYCDFFGNLAIGSKFMVWMGYRIAEGYDYLFPYGIYVLDAPVLESNTASKIANISGTDKWSMLNGINGGILQAPYIVPTGTYMGDVVPDLLSLDVTSDPKVPSIFGLDYAQQMSAPFNSIIPPLFRYQMTYDITKDIGAYVSDILLDICANANAYVYYNANGRLIVKPYDYDSVKPSIHDFVGEQENYASNDINYISAQKTYNYSELYNATIVVADSVQDDNIPIIAEAINNDISDPNSFTNLGYKKYKVINQYVNGITNTQQAQERANYELKKVAAMQSSISLTCLPLYHLEVNNIVTVTDPFINANNERFLIKSITTPMSIDGEMTLELVKAKGYEEFGGQ